MKDQKTPLKKIFYQIKIQSIEFFSVNYKTVNQIKEKNRWTQNFNKELETIRRMQPEMKN